MSSDEEKKEAMATINRVSAILDGANEIEWDSGAERSEILRLQDVARIWQDALAEERGKNEPSMPPFVAAVEVMDDFYDYYRDNVSAKAVGLSSRLREALGGNYLNTFEERMRIRRDARQAENALE